MSDNQPRTQTVLDDLEILKRYEEQLRDAEAAASAAYRKVESLRGVVGNLRSYLGMPARPSVRMATAAEIAQHKANQLVDYERRKVDEAAGRDRRPSARAASAIPPVEQQTLPGEAPTPRGREAVRQILIETRRTMHVNELVDEVKARWWMTDVENPWNALSAAAKRLVKDGEVEQVGRATYRYRVDKLPPVDLVPTSRTTVSAGG